jgi:hypothetical protein
MIVDVFPPGATIIRDVNSLRDLLVGHVPSVMMPAAVSGSMSIAASQGKGRSSRTLSIVALDKADTAIELAHFRERKASSMIGFIRLASIVANLTFAVFLWFLIQNQEGTLRWVHSVNPLWALFVLIAIIALATGCAEYSERNKNQEAAKRLTRDDGKSTARKADPTTAP